MIIFKAVISPVFLTFMKLSNKICAMPEQLWGRKDEDEMLKMHGDDLQRRMHFLEWQLHDAKSRIVKMEQERDTAAANAERIIAKHMERLTEYDSVFETLQKDSATLHRTILMYANEMAQLRTAMPRSSRLPAPGLGSYPPGTSIYPTRAGSDAVGSSWGPLENGRQEERGRGETGAGVFESRYGGLW